MSVHEGASVVRRGVLKKQRFSFEAASKKAINTQMDLCVSVYSGIHVHTFDSIIHIVTYTHMHKIHTYICMYYVVHMQKLVLMHTCGVSSTVCSMNPGRGLMK